jgi:hypothetical protein
MVLSMLHAWIVERMPGVIIGPAARNALPPLPLEADDGTEKERRDEANGYFVQVPR